MSASFVLIKHTEQGGHDAEGIAIGDIMSQIGISAADAVREILGTSAAVALDLMQEIDISQKLQEVIEDHLQEIRELLPYLEQELKKPEYGGKSLEDLEAEAPRDDLGIAADDSLYMIALDAARTARDQDRQRVSDRQRSQQPEYSSIKYNPIPIFKVPTDKFLRDFFFVQPQDDTSHGNSELTQSGLAKTGRKLKYEGNNKKTPVTLVYDYFMEKEKLKKFNVDAVFIARDVFAFITLDNLYEVGNTEVTLTKIFHEMGGTGSPGSKHTTEIFAALLRGDSTTILADTRAVMKEWGEAGGRFSLRRIIDVDLSSFDYSIDRKTGKLKIKDGIVKIKGHTIFYEVAEAIGHLTGYDRDFLKLYKGHKTKMYYSVLFFLITQIAWLRNPRSKRSNKILYSSLYEATGAKTKKQKKSAREMMLEILTQVFMPIGHIKTAKEDMKGEPGVKLTYTKAGLIT